MKTVLNAIWKNKQIKMSKKILKEEWQGETLSDIKTLQK